MKKNYGNGKSDPRPDPTQPDPAPSADGPDPCPSLGRPIGRIARLARPSVRPSSVCSGRARNSKTKKKRRKKLKKVENKKVECQFSDEKVKGQGHRTSKTTETWRRIYLPTADEAQADRVLTAN